MLELHISSTSSCLKKPWVASHPPFIPQPLPAAFHGRPFSPSLKAAPRSRIYAAASSCKHVCHAASAVEATQPSLQPFLQWLVANGTEGVGTEASKIALYSTETGERGVIAVAPIKRGEVIAKVPLRLAITDSPDDEESNALEHAGAPWSVQIACKLLRMRAEGDACPWKPYIDVLPASVPAPAASFSWDERQRVAYEPMLKQMDTAVWFASDAWARLPSNAAGPSPSRASFEWALSVVHSRTFGLAAIGGGVGVRLLMPLIDMLNHAGDVALAPFGAADPHAQACDNVRWDVVTKLGGEQVMVMSATKAIEANEELLLSYGERANDDFFLFYGFCPPRNPHDHVELFTSIEDAIDWHLKRYIPKVREPKQVENVACKGSAAGKPRSSTLWIFNPTNKE